MFNKIEWAKCPHCNTLLNDWRIYPASLLMENNSKYDWIELVCPGPYAGSCGKKIAVQAVRTVQLKAEAVDE